MKNRSLIFMTGILSLVALLIGSSCTKKESNYEPLYMTVNLPRLTCPYGSYFTLDYSQQSLELDFSLPVDATTLKGNVIFGESENLPDSFYTVTSFGRKVFIEFKPFFQLKEGWRYYIRINTGLRSTTGITLSSASTIELRTTTQHPGVLGNANGRNSILCISDIHMGDPRAASLGYSWFSKNAPALDSLLTMIIRGNTVRQLVILGDLFDEWVVPYRINPFDPGTGISDSREYFLAIAAAPVNAGIIGKLKTIASGGNTQLIYIPGNHDMLLTQSILQEIIPGIVWSGDADGLGSYSPLDEIVMEHGHRYDFFNCPQPLTNPGHRLPPGYFISRLDAEGLMEHAGGVPSEKEAKGDDLLFLTAWTAAYAYLVFHYDLTVAPDSANIALGGIDGYPGPLSFNGVMEMYAANIEEVWPATLLANQMPVSMPVAMAILNGSSDLSFTATFEYMETQAPRHFNIVAFGHTHHAMLQGWPTGKNPTAIYANTGTWVNAELASHPVRTFIEIQPAAWTGAAIDVVSLYQYNLDSGSGKPDPPYVPVLLAQESIVR
jgi:UDP-2,3-diacylglucosamine pyrophosphatase LpxH